jgi:hypothetical protein
MNAMKQFALLLLVTILAASSARAALIIVIPDTDNVTTSGSTFSFSQFNTTLGTLTAVDLIIESSTLQGNATINRTSGSQTITDMFAVLTFEAAPGFDEYSTDSFSYARNPSGNITVNATNTSRLVTVTGTNQSLIGGSPITLGINSASFGAYTGLGTVDFNVALFAGQTATGVGAATYNYANLLSPTSLALRYTYSTDPSPIPEPGQVAASLLLLGGIGTYFLIKRRRFSSASV